MRVPGRCCDCGPRATTVEKMPLLRDGNSSLKRAGVVGAWGQRSTAIDSLGLWPLVSIWWERRIIAAAILEGMAASLKRNVYAHIKIYILKSRRISAIPRIQRWRRGFSHGPLRIPDRFFLGSEIADADKTLRIVYTPPLTPTHHPPGGDTLNVPDFQFLGLPLLPFGRGWLEPSKLDELDAGM